jgi:molecular chaperone GrpE (heat shock protein)
MERFIPTEYNLQTTRDKSIEIVETSGVGDKFEIVKVEKPGYRYASTGTVLRPAKVIVRAFK